MIRHAALFAAGLIVGSCKAPEYPSARPDANRDGISNMTVALVATTPDGEVKPYCAGVWVSRTLILTANHCVSRYRNDVIQYLVRSDIYASNRGSAENYPLEPRIGLLEAFDSEHDLALIRTPEAPSTHLFAQLRAIPVDQGMTVRTIGHSLGFWYSFTRGEVSAVRYAHLFDDEELPSLVVQSAIAISPGNSGGGLFDDEGDLLGVTHGSYTQGQGVNMFVHVKYVRELMKGVEL